MSSLVKIPWMRSGGKWPKSWERSLRALTAALSCAASNRSLDLTMWVSRRWRGEVSNMQPHEHDAVGWFTAAQVEELKLADPSYLPGVGQRCGGRRPR
jgi:hypothetical protein